MKKTCLTAVVLVALFGLFGVGCSPASQSDSREADATAIRQAVLAWSAAQVAFCIDGTMSVYLDDAISCPSNRSMARGMEARRESSESRGIGSPGSSVTWQPMKIEVARSGDIGYAIGTFESVVDDAPVKGKYVEIWKKQADGSWKVAADMFSPDSPPAPF